MQTAKQEVEEILAHLPEDCTLEDIQYHLYVLQKIKRGLDDARNGRVYSHEDIETRLSKWLGKDSLVELLESPAHVDIVKIKELNLNELEEELWTTKKNSS